MINLADRQQRVNRQKGQQMDHRGNNKQFIAHRWIDVQIGSLSRTCYIVQPNIAAGRHRGGWCYRISIYFCRPVDWNLVMCGRGRWQLLQAAVAGWFPVCTLRHPESRISINTGRPATSLTDLSSADCCRCCCYSTLYTFHTSNATLHTPHFTLHTPRSTLKAPRFTLLTRHFTL